VVSISHGWGALPGQLPGDPRNGVSTNLLVSTKWMVEPINGMPAMSAIPVDVHPIAVLRHRGTLSQ
jgi:hypothetical protein